MYISRTFPAYSCTKVTSSCSFGRHFSSSDVLQLLDRFYNLEMLVRVVIYVEVSYHLPKDNCSEYGTAYGELLKQNHVFILHVEWKLCNSLAFYMPYVGVPYVIITKFWC